MEEQNLRRFVRFWSTFRASFGDQTSLVVQMDDIIESIVRSALIVKTDFSGVGFSHKTLKKQTTHDLHFRAISMFACQAQYSFNFTSFLHDIVAQR